MNLSSPKNVKEALQKSLGKLGKIDQCALLNCPDHINIGDYLIWLGEIFYLTDVLETKINYATGLNFSRAEMDKQVGKAPILLHGGGNLGELWLRHQESYETIISEYRDRPIIIFPQSIYFSNSNRLDKAADIFNSHPNLTLFVRENYSYELATQHFDNCQIIKAPDMAFQMVQMPGLLSKKYRQDSILYHRRGDKELNQNSAPSTIDLPNLVIEDWASYKYKKTPSAASIQGMTTLIKEGRLGEWLSRQKWQYFHPYVAKFKNVYNPSLQRKAWNFMHDGVYQFRQHRLVITNRLHGHILCLLLEIPHVFLANAYHKNESFYETWTHEIPFCRFVKDASGIQVAAQELLELFPT